MPTVRLAAHVRPGAARPGVGGSHGGAVVVRVAARAEGGRANTAVVAEVARALHVPRSAVRIASGATSRRKVVEVVAADEDGAAAVAAGWARLAAAAD